MALVYCRGGGAPGRWGALMLAMLQGSLSTANRTQSVCLTSCAHGARVAPGQTHCNDDALQAQGFVEAILTKAPEQRFTDSRGQNHWVTDPTLTIGGSGNSTLTRS